MTDVAWPAITAGEYAGQQRQNEAENDHYYHAPARDQAEREVYDRLEQLEAEIAAAREAELEAEL